MFHELPPEVRRIIFGECARVLKPGGRLVLVDSLQRGDRPDYEGLFELFPQNYHEPYYASYTTEDFGAIARACGLTHIALKFKLRHYPRSRLPHHEQRAAS